jgi:hypothetical protein
MRIPNRSGVDAELSPEADNALLAIPPGDTKDAILKLLNGDLRDYAEPRPPGYLPDEDEAPFLVLEKLGEHEGEELTRVNGYVIFHQELTEQERRALERPAVPRPPLADHWVSQILSLAQLVSARLGMAGRPEDLLSGWARITSVALSHGHERPSLFGEAASTGHEYGDIMREFASTVSRAIREGLLDERTALDFLLDASRDIERSRSSSTHRSLRELEMVLRRRMLDLLQRGPRNSIEQRQHFDALVELRRRVEQRHEHLPATPQEGPEPDSPETAAPGSPDP